MGRLLVLVAVFGVLPAGCYHFTFEQAPAPPPVKYVTYEERVGTYLNGFIGNGQVDTRRYCERPARTELRVTGMDVLLGAATLLIYTPHTLYVTCPEPATFVHEQTAR
jgi:hypothetical protein